MTEELPELNDILEDLEDSLESWAGSSGTSEGYYHGRGYEAQYGNCEADQNYSGEQLFYESYSSQDQAYFMVRTFKNT